MEGDNRKGDASVEGEPGCLRLEVGGTVVVDQRLADDSLIVVPDFLDVRLPFLFDLLLEMEGSVIELVCKGAIALHATPNASRLSAALCVYGSSRLIVRPSWHSGPSRALGGPEYRLTSHTESS